MAKKKRTKQAFTGKPKNGKSFNERGTPGGMGGMFGSVTPKKPEFDRNTPTKSQTQAKRAERMKRLDKRLI